MYKSPLDNFNDFYNQVFEKETASKQNNSKVEKSYFEYKTENVDLRIPHDTVVHVENGHGLQLNEWADFFNNISTPTDIAISNKPRYDGSPLLLKYNINGKTYGAVIEFFENKKPILTTVFSDTEKKVSDWIKENSHSQAKNTSSVTAKGMLLSNDYNSILSYFKNKLNPSRQDVYQTQNIQDKFGQSVEELQEMFSEDIKNILAENEINSDEFEIEDVRLYGSYTTGKNKDTSDLDVIVQYKGSMKEDTAFNLLNDAKLTITDVNGIERKIDINPINSRLSGSIDEHIERMHEIDGTYFQSAATAGAETSAEISDAQKEWKEKGTGSKYFKKWFGDSKVVDENGQPLVVYHGSPSHDITTFDSDKTLYGEISKGFNFFTNKKSAYQNSADDYANFAGTNGYRRNGKVYETYLKIQKPLHIKYTSNAMSLYNGDKRYSTPVEYYDTNYKEIKEKYNNGDYDGIIIENTDKNNDDSIIYLVPNSEQIKSVGNRGTFDKSNPNIYYQNAGTNYQEQVQDVKNNLEYKKFVNKVLSGKLSQKEKAKPFHIGKTPAKLIEAGLPDNEVCIGYKIIEKAQNNKNPDHNLSRETISKVWEALKNPIAVIKAEQNENEKQENNRYSAILDLQDDNGKYVLVAFEVDKNIGSGIIVNDIRSIHSRKSYEPIIDKALNDKRLLKVDAEKIRNLLLGNTNSILESDQASSEKDLLTSQQSDLISDGTASLINSISQKYDKTRYKSINKMFATLKNPTFVNVSKNSGMYYFKIFKTNGGTKNQTVVVRTNELGEVVETTYPTKRDNNYFEKLKIGKTVYDVKNQRRKGDNNTAPVNNSIANNSTNNKPKRTGYVFQEPAQPNLFVENAAQNHNKGFVGIDLKGNRGLTDINRNYNDILSKGLQSTDLVFKTDNKNEYYNFIHFDNTTNEQILVELSENKDNYEIVNFYKFSDKSLERKIKKANNEGGQILITDSNAKGAAVLSALGVSPNNIITINSTNNKSKRTGYVFQEPAQPNLFVENASQNHNKGFVGIDLKGNRGLTDINRNLILIGTNPLNTKDKKITCLMS